MFLKAQPIWVKDRESDIHMTVQFKAICPKSDNAIMKIASSGIYHLVVNGKFVAYGPARAGRNHFRMDELNITSLLDREENVIVLEVCGYNTSSYYIQNQKSFIQAELVANSTPVVWTGKDFTARIHPSARVKTQRYGFQRPMVEAYNITSIDTFMTDLTTGSEILAETEAKNIVARYAPYPNYEVTESQPITSGTVEGANLENHTSYRHHKEIDVTKLVEFPPEELEICATDDCSQMTFHPSDKNLGGNLDENTYTIYKFPYNATGMLHFKVKCESPMTLFVTFDEILLDGKVDFLRANCANAIRYDLCAGEHELQFFEVYTMQYFQMTAIGGKCTIEGIPYIIEYKHPPIDKKVKVSSPAFQKIADAAIETFRQNAVDLFTDCPSRERAGWLCDSFFSGRVEYFLTGESPVEKSFLENFLHDDNYPDIPEGMVPMCYPADHNNHTFIPQWSLWLVIELEEYLKRSGDTDLIEKFRPRIEKLLKYFTGFENEDGLLEHLDSWNFVDWSHANEVVQDVNYPTNMLYSYALKAAARLYGDESLKVKGEKIVKTVCEQSFDGHFFVDNAVRKDGKLVLTGERTEACQNYAFFFEVANPTDHANLLETLIKDFGPDRKTTNKWPEIHFANAFIGNYLRLEMLMKLGYRQAVLDNIEGFFLYMAERTGTLWELVRDNASCNHGFASYVIYWLDQLSK